MASIIARIVGDSTDFNKKVSGVKGQVNLLKKAFAGLTLGLGAGAIVNWLERFISHGSKITDVADKIGVSTEFLQQWNFMAQESGVAARQAEMALQRFTRRLGEAAQGKGELLPILEQYNIRIKDSAGGTRSARDVMEDLAEVVAHTKDPTERLRIAFKAFDSEGAALVTVLKQGKQGMDDMAESAVRLGQVIGDDAVQAADRQADAIERYKNRFLAAGTEIVGKLIQIDELWGVITGRDLGDVDPAAERRIAEQQKLRDIAKEIVTANGTIKKLQMGLLPTIKEYVNINGELIPIQTAIRDKMRELNAAQEHAKAVAVEQKQAEVEQLRLKGANAEQSKEIQKIMAATQEEALAKLDQEFKLQQDKTAELHKQKMALADQFRSQSQQVDALRQQSEHWEKIGRFQPTFQDVASGAVGGSTSATRRANDIIEMRSELSDMLLRGFSKENLDRSHATLKRLEDNFEDAYGVDPKQNPFKAALKKAEDELVEIRKEVKNF